MHLINWNNPFFKIFHNIKVTRYMQVSNHIIKSIDKELIKSSAKLSYHYAFTRPLKLGQNKPNYVTPVYESIISQNAQYSYHYAKLVLGSRFELGEEAISKSIEYSLRYAIHVLQERFELGEEVISKNHVYARYYTDYILKQDFYFDNKLICRFNSNVFN